MKRTSRDGQQFLHKSLNIKKKPTYDTGNPGHGLGQAPKCGRVKPIYGNLLSI
jgi:hypothetical protein